MEGERMNPITIMISVDHIGKPPTESKLDNPLNRGATHQFSKKDILYAEADLAHQYAFGLFRRLTGDAIHHKFPFHPFLLTHGYYPQRGAFANQYNANLYLSCHINSAKTPPKSNYCLVETSELAGPDTTEIANRIAENLSNGLNIINTGVNTIKRGERGWDCIAHVKAPAILIEPFFLNHVDSWRIVSEGGQGLWKVSNAIYKAIRDFSW
jgi:hypothetical protein